MLKNILLESFDNRIKDVFEVKQPNVCKFLLNHERKNVCINNMLKLVTDAEKLSPLKKEDVQYVARSYADTFSNAALTFEEQNAISEIERSRLIRKNDEQEEFSKYIDEITSVDSL